MITPACKPVLGGRPGSVLACSAGPSDMSDINEVLLRQAGKNACPRCPYQVIVYLFGSIFWMSRKWAPGVCLALSLICHRLMVENSEVSKWKMNIKEVP